MIEHSDYAIGYRFIQAYAADWSLERIWIGINNAMHARFSDPRNVDYAEGFLAGLTDLAAQRQAELDASTQSRAA